LSCKPGLDHPRLTHVRLIVHVQHGLQCVHPINMGQPSSGLTKKSASTGSTMGTVVSACGKFTLDKSAKTAGLLDFVKVSTIAVRNAECRPPGPATPKA
jgi:hypothetical protein